MGFEAEAMTTEQLPGQQTGPHRGAPRQRPPQRWSARKTIAAVAIAAGVAAAGGTAIYVAGGSGSSSSAQAGPGGQPMPGGGQADLASALHGEYVVSDGSGGYTTALMQIGKVTAISSTSLTAKSDDGYTKTYTIDSDTAVGSIATGDTVTVVASVSGDTATAGTITEGTAQAGPGGMGQQGTLPRRDDSAQG